MAYCLDLYTLDREIRAKGRANLLTLIWSARGYFLRSTNAGGGSDTAGLDLVNHVLRFKQHLRESRKDQETAAGDLEDQLQKAWLPLNSSGEPAMDEKGSIECDMEKKKERAMQILRIKAELSAAEQRSAHAERESRRVKVIQS